MGGGWLAVDILLHDAILIDSDGGQNVKGVLVARIDTVKHEAHNNLLPGGAALVPELGSLEIDNVADVLHDAVHGARRQHLVFVVVGDGDQEFRVSVVHCLP